MLENFIERWKRQGTQESPAPSIDDYFQSLIDIEAVAVHDDPDRNWNVQVRVDHGIFLN